MGGQVASMVFVNVMWGLSFIASKHAMNAGFTPMTLALTRYVLTALCFLPFAAKREGLRIKWRDLPMLVLSGLTGITVYYFCEYNGIQRTSTSSASLILAAIPILTMVVEAIAWRKRMRPAQIAGACLSLAGVGLILLSSSDEGRASLTGDLFILGASVVWVAYIFISRRLRKSYSSLKMNTVQSLTAVVTLLPLALPERCDVTRVPWDGWAAVAVLALVCSALCYYLYGNALFEMSPLASAIFINLIPLTTLIGGAVLLNERITWLTLVGGGLIIGSIFLVNMAEDKK